MNHEYFSILEKGLRGELEFLPLPEVVSHFRNYQTNYLLDRTVATCYLARFGLDFGPAMPAEAREELFALAGLYAQLKPFALPEIKNLPLVRADPAARLKVEILEKLNFDPQTLTLIGDLDPSRDGEEARGYYLQLLKGYPNYALAAQELLALDHHLARDPADWLPVFRCPGRLADDWRALVFGHYAGLGLAGKALALWPALAPGAVREATLNAAAEVFRAAGDTAQAQALYRRSLALDPRQVPVRLRLAELASPSAARPELLGQRRVTICLYSFNKAAMLGRTLEGLAASAIGPARIKVLLNGCTDDSRAVAEAARMMFPDNAFEIIELPVNVGAPAARNWLIAQPETRAGDYAAFLDDDVDLSPDWLTWLLTVAERDPKIGVVGCKVVFPGTPAQLQYLYRYVSVARDDLLKMSLDVPVRQYDTGLYEVVRETRNVMGCAHLLKVAALNDAPSFDLRFSPSQVDDIDHDLQLALKGWRIMYCGLTTCVHHQNSGVSERTATDIARVGNCVGNDLKLFCKHAPHMAELKKLDNLSLADSAPAFTPD